MLFQEPVFLVFIAAFITLALVWGVWCVLGRRGASVKKKEDSLGDIGDQLCRISGQISPELFTQIKEEGIDLIPKLVSHWPEISPEIREQLWDFWESQGYIDNYIKRLGSKNEEVCIEAAQVLMKLKNKKLILPLVDALMAPDQFVPARVGEVLLSYGSDASEVMIRRLPELPPEARCQVISILEEFGNPQAVSCLLNELTHPSSQVRIKAVDALGTLGNGKITESLIKMMDDADWKVRAAAAKALGKTQAPQGIPALEKALKDEAWWVRKNAEEAIKKISFKNS
ncbi:MAG: HEAT repeat domain-containing protein [Bacillota bacterium]|nr:HEAT repeat domain-containing protein [Clostridia bacterium]